MPGSKTDMGDMLRRWRCMARMNQRTFAARVGVSVRCVGDWEAYRYVPTVAHRKAIARCLTSDQYKRRDYERELDRAATQYSLAFARRPKLEQPQVRA